MSPLMDCVFILLIFFIVTTTFVEESGVQVERPQPGGSGDNESTTLTLHVTTDGKVMHSNRDIGVNGVRGLVTRLLQQRDMPVILLADQKADAGVVVDVIDECKLAGAEQVSVAATRE
jgi:biopolymer transport protein ExbD